MLPLVHIVDDDVHVRAATSYLLASHGFPTEVYASAEEFLDQANLERGCVLLDLRMPGLDGLGTMVRLAARRVTIPTIMMTGHGDLGTAVQAMKLGAIDFIEKPYQEEQLLAAITRALDLRAQERRRTEGRSDALARTAKLSPRELQVLQGLVGGLSNKGIARRLELSPRTVEMHRARMMEDLGCGSLSEAVRIAIDAGLSPLGAKCSEPAGIRAAMLPPPGDPCPKLSTIEPVPPAEELLEGAIDCIFLLDDAWRFTYLNRNAVEKIGRGRDLRGTIIWDSFPLAIDTLGWAELHRSAAERTLGRFEFFEPDVDCWFDVNVRPVASGLQVAFRDITAERQTNVALQMSEETLRMALEATGDGAWDWNIETGKITMSGRFVQHLGYAPGELRDDIDAVRELVHADDWRVLDERLRDHLSGKSDTFACEYRFRRRDGSWCWNFDRGRVVARDALSGAPLRMVGTACDVSDRKAAEARAREALERLALAQGNSGAGTWDLDLETYRLQLCPRSLEMHGLSPDGPTELSDEQWRACLHPDDVASTREALDTAVRTKTGLSIRYRTVMGQKCKWVHGLGSLVPGSRDQAARFVGLNLDVTDSMEAECALQRMQSEIVHLSRVSAMGALATTLAHELNQPLTAITGFVGGVRRYVEAGEPNDRPSALEAIEGAERGVHYAAEIVRRLREQTSDAVPERKPDSLSATISEAVQLCGPRGKGRHGIDLEIDEAADRVVIDRIQIEQVLLNLLRNAIDVCETSGSTKQIVVSAVPFTESMALVRVSDNGGGVPDLLKDEIFKVSFTTKPQGMGLGLSICRTIVENHGGEMWVENNQSGGADFCFTVPCQ
ncbi:MULTISPECIES: PAS domain-containing protein [unclassified Sphingobium]|uniref:PAS domain-containing protein n=1 Tax=unclassified Sphingobium TaxID=2611147 RepID=UPI0011999F80|nr:MULTISPECIES: PAS domain-containing protein [unclassified Sphingobium]TWC97718.1 PAS domain S-box-containing protein [Sphingobium sp. AEW010]TWD17814.1 PAS domain S-box-containing protein [Sphingobium sp. AEW013]TWD20064.1 PAS domain S-box-containing protein [Sphingobium sp. AEW001]